MSHVAGAIGLVIGIAIFVTRNNLNLIAASGGKHIHHLGQICSAILREFGLIFWRFFVLIVKA